MKLYDPYAEITKNVLPNGLEVHSTFWDRPWMNLSFVIHSGGREDPVQRPGLAHFVEHLTSGNIPNREYDEAKYFFDKNGGGARFGSTSYLSTTYGFRIPATLDALTEALGIFGSMLFQAKIEDHIERERNIITQEFNRRYPIKERYEWDLNVRKSVFKGHRVETWSRPLGSPEGFGIANKEDLQGFYDTHYVPSNMSIMAIGGIHKGDFIAALMESPFGMQKKGVRNPIRPPVTTFVVPEDRVQVITMSEHTSLKVTQMEYVAVWAFPISFQGAAKDVFDKMLNTILWDEVRQKHELAYSFGTTCFNYEDVIEYVINGKINPDALEKIDGIVRHCIDKISSSVDLFEKKRNASIQKLYMLDSSGADVMGGAVNDLIGDRKITTVQGEIDKLKKVSFKQIVECAAILNPHYQYTYMIRP